MTRTYHITELAALPVHPTAAKFPMMAVSEKDGMGNNVPGPLTRLADDLAKNGCHTPVVVWKGNLLDGRNRIAAAQMAGLDTIPTMEYTGPTPVAYIVSLNVERRMLTPTQLDILAVELEPDFAEEAEARMKAGTPQLADASQGRAIQVAAKEVGSGNAEKAKAVKNLAPDLYEKMVDGKLTTSQAYAMKNDTYVNPDGARIAKPVVAAPQITSLDGLMDKADRAYDSYTDVIEGLGNINAPESELKYVASQLRKLLNKEELRDL